MRDIRIDGFSDEQLAPIIKGVDLTLKRGESWASSVNPAPANRRSGKAAMGYTQPGCKLTGGSILFDGMDLAKASDRRSAQLWGTRIAYVAQSAAASFNPAHRLIDQTVEAANRRGICARRGIPRRRGRAVQGSAIARPGNHRQPLSASGFRRAVAAGDDGHGDVAAPDLIIFDEPTTALDVTTQVEVLSAMRNIVEEFNTAAIYITHDLAVVAQMADFIKVLRYGEEVEQAPTRQMLTAARHALHQVALVRARAGKARGQGRRHRSARSTTSMPPMAGQGAARCEHFDAARANRGGGRGIRLRQIHHCTGDHRTAAAISGERVFNGEPLPAALKDRSKDQLQRIQMIYQMADTAMNPRQTVEEIIGRPLEFYLGLKGQGARRIPCPRASGDDRARREFHGPAAVRTVRRAETAHLHRPRACRKPESSSATKSPPRSTRSSRKASCNCCCGCRSNTTSPISSSPMTLPR
jgi:peptide/nickel transport system ATP-binding protein